jgi:hypothetical protein
LEGDCAHDEKTIPFNLPNQHEPTPERPFAWRPPPAGEAETRTGGKLAREVVKKFHKVPFSSTPATLAPAPIVLHISLLRRGFWGAAVSTQRQKRVWNHAGRSRGILTVPIGLDSPASHVHEMLDDMPIVEQITASDRPPAPSLWNTAGGRPFAAVVNARSASQNP